MIKNAILFTTPTCVNCKRVKLFLEQQSFPTEIIDATTPEGSKKAQDAGIQSVPSVFLYDETGTEHFACDIEGVEELL